MKRRTRKAGETLKRCLGAHPDARLVVYADRRPPAVVMPLRTFIGLSRAAEERTDECGVEPPDTRILLRAIPGGLRVTIEGKSREKPMTPGQMRELAIDLLETAERDDIAAELAKRDPFKEVPV